MNHDQKSVICKLQETKSEESLSDKLWISDWQLTEKLVRLFFFPGENELSIFVTSHNTTSTVQE